jgi:alcohol dehydrogenase class IV
VFSASLWQFFYYANDLYKGKKMSIYEEILSTKIFGASIEFGVGIINNLPEYIKEMGISKPLIVTDKGIIRAGILSKILPLLDNSAIKYIIFDNVQQNPTDINVMDGLEEYRHNKCDSVIGIGGGSPIDTAKAIRVMAERHGHIRDYCVPNVVIGNKPILIAIPTMSGTGSEVSTGSIITDTEQNRKRIIRHIPPTLAIVDPEMTLGVPSFLTAATGVDALSHSIEAYVTKIYNPLAGAIALAGFKLVAKSLRRAVANGSDIGARRDMSMSSTMGALAFNKGLGASHSLAHQLSTDANVHHGVANAIMLPHVMEFNLESAVQEYADIAQAMGVDISGMSVEQSARASVQAVRDLCKDVGLPDRLGIVGVSEDIIPTMAEKAMEDHCHLKNPRTCTKEDMIALYGKAF